MIETSEDYAFGILFNYMLAGRFPIEYIVGTVSEMVDLLESNALQAEAAYQDAYVEITGRLGNIDSIN